MLGSIGQKRDQLILAHWLYSGPDPFGQSLAQSASNKSDPSGFVPYYPGCIRTNGTESKSGKLIAGRL